jgi:hypothetical protein
MNALRKRCGNHCLHFKIPQGSLPGPNFLVETGKKKCERLKYPALEQDGLLVKWTFVPAIAKN